jgi:glycosyltransferase involved in cell wall biosynthesis
VRIVHLSSVHPHHDTRIFVRMCRSLAAAGHEVHWVVPRADTERDEVQDGVHVHAVRPAARRLQRMTGTVARVLRTAAALGGDLYHLHDPELLWAAPWWQRRLGRPFVYDAHEDYRLKMREKDWLPSPLRAPAEWTVGRVEDWAASHLAGVVTATPTICERFAAHPARVTIHNFPAEAELAPAAEKAEREPGLCAYVGQVAVVRAAREMVLAAGLAHPDVRLVLAGPFSPPSLRDTLTGVPGWARVDAPGHLDRREVVALLGRASVGLALLHPTPAYLAAYPTKLFEYLLAGLPVIVADFPLYRELLRDADCARFVDPREPNGIAQAMTWLATHPAEAADMGRRGRGLAVARFSWEAELPRLLAFYDRVVAHWRDRTPASGA